MLARTFSCAVVGLDGVIVEVEVDYTNGLPGMTIVGLPDAAVEQRIRTRHDLILVTTLSLKISIVAPALISLFKKVNENK